MVEDISKLFNKLMEDLDANISDKAKKTKIKNELIELVALFISSSNNIVRIQDKQEATLNKIKKIEKRLAQIEEDIYIDDEDNYDKMHDNDYEFEIRCPYCDYDFIISEELQRTDEIECPKCHNAIELDWDEVGNCAGDCKGCNQHCYQEDDETDNLAEELSDNNENYNTDVNKKNDEKDNNLNKTNKQNENNKDTKPTDKNDDKEDDM